MEPYHFSNKIVDFGSGGMDRGRQGILAFWGAIQRVQHKRGERRWEPM